MELFSTAEYLILSGLVLGVVMGATARRARFCTFGAVEDYILIGKTDRLRAWALAIAVAILGVQLLLFSDVARIDQVFYLGPVFGLLGAIIGGLLFGLGMAMVGTCGYGVIIRAAGGDLKSLCNFLVLAVSGYMTARGLFSIFRNGLIDRFDFELTPVKGQGVPHFLEWAFGIETGPQSSFLWLGFGFLFGGALLYFCFKDKNFRASRRDVAAGILIGLCVVGAFGATGYLGSDPFDEVRVQAISYVLPLGDSLIYLMTYSGSVITFPVALVLGTFLGSFIMAYWCNELRFESYDGVREMRRHMLGAMAMGAGGITAHGCTIGQGISGVSTLALSPMIALFSIFVGASFGLHWVLSGSAREAFDLLLGRSFND